MKKLWILMIVVLIAMNLTGCMLPIRPSNEEDTNTEIEIIEEPEEPEIEYIEITATELLYEFNENGVNYELTYADKYVKVTGTVKNIDIDFTDNAYVSLKDDNSSYTFWGVMCYFDDDEMEALSVLREDDIIIITGICQSSKLAPMIYYCELIEVLV